MTTGDTFHSGGLPRYLVAIWTGVPRTALRCASSPRARTYATSTWPRTSRP